MSRSHVRAVLEEPILVPIMIEFIGTILKAMFTDTGVVLTGGFVTFFISLVILNTWCLYDKPTYFTNFLKEGHALLFVGTVFASVVLASMWPFLAVTLAMIVISIPFLYILKHLCGYLLKRFVQK